MQQTFHTVILLALLLSSFFTVGCTERELTEKQATLEAIKQLAPAGGTGKKQYLYDSGEIREKVYWQDYQVEKISYFSLAGKKLYTAKFDENGKGLVIILNKEGQITEIAQVKNGIKEGACFVIEDGILKKIQTVTFDGLENEVVITD